MRPLGLAILLSSAAFGATPVSTQEVLSLAGKALQGFWEQLSNVNCVESVQQIKLGPNGKALYKQDSSFDYLVALQLTGNDILVEESRVPIAKPDERKDVPLLLTNGFSTMAFIFHPAFQSSFEYYAPIPVEFEGSNLLEVRFRMSDGVVVRGDAETEEPGLSRGLARRCLDRPRHRRNRPHFRQSDARPGRPRPQNAGCRRALFACQVQGPAWNLLAARGGNH